MKPFACWLLLGDNTSLSHKKTWPPNRSSVYRLFPTSLFYVYVNQSSQLKCSKMVYDMRALRWTMNQFSSSKYEQIVPGKCQQALVYISVSLRCCFNLPDFKSRISEQILHTDKMYFANDWCAILIAHQIVMTKHGGSCVHFSEISTCGRTSRETVSHPQCPPLPTLCEIS